MLELDRRYAASLARRERLVEYLESIEPAALAFLRSERNLTDFEVQYLCTTVARFLSNESKICVLASERREVCLGN